MNKVAKEKELYLENYYLKNKRAIDKGKEGPTYGWVIPAGQRRAADAADMVNELRRQGVEVQTATSSFKDGNVDVAAGDYLIRGDQPYRTLVDMYMSVQNYPPQNPRPYDDTGWTMQYMRNVKVIPVTGKDFLSRPMNMLTSEARPNSTVQGSGATLIVEHTTDNALMAFRFKNRDVTMLAAEDDFEAGGKKLRAGSFIIPNANRSVLDASLKELGLSAIAAASTPSVKTHEMKTPRIGYVHSWSRTQDEGWVRAALDHYGVPYTYFADQKLREGNLRAKYDVIVFPHVGGNSASHITGIPMTGPPLPYRKTADTPNLGFVDQSDDIRGGMGMDGMTELMKFVEAGGTLITEGSTTALLAEYNMGGGVTVEHPDKLFARGTILRGQITDMKSPIAYGYSDKDLPVYFNQDPVLSVAVGGGGFGGFGGGGAAEGQNVTPNAIPVRVAPFGAEPPLPVLGGSGPVTPTGNRAAPGPGGGFGGFGGFGAPDPASRPRVVMQFPQSAADMLLSGTLAGGEALSNRVLAADVTMGKGHVVMFALRPFWRWQAQGTFFLAFNAILNWDHLDAGQAPPAAPSRTNQQQ
jgi:hypothetical protein